MKNSALFLLAFFAIFTFTSLDFTGYKIGDKVKDFKLKNTVNDKNVSLSDYKNAKGFIVIFTCNHCPFAKAYEERIISLDKKYAPKGFPVIAISPNDPEIQPADSPEKMKERALEKNYSFPYLFDDKQEVAKAFGAVRTPHTFILAKNNNDYVVKYIGAIDDNSEEPDAVKNHYIENALDEIIAGKNVSTPSTKAIGCTIKWKK